MWFGTPFHNPLFYHIQSSFTRMWSYLGSVSKGTCNYSDHPDTHTHPTIQ